MTLRIIVKDLREIHKCENCNCGELEDYGDMKRCAFCYSEFTEEKTKDCFVFR